MSSVYKIVGTLCITGYVMGILMNFITTNYTGKSIRLVTALYLITAVFNSENHFDFNIKIDDIVPQQQQIYRDNTEYIISLAQAKVEEKIKSILEEKNVSYEKVNVHIYKQTEKIYIHNVEILGTEKSDREYIIEILQNTVQRKIITFGD